MGRKSSEPPAALHTDTHQPPLPSPPRRSSAARCPGGLPPPPSPRRTRRPAHDWDKPALPGSIQTTPCILILTGGGGAGPLVQLAEDRLVFFNHILWLAPLAVP